MPEFDTPFELRCFCSEAPLLARCGVAESGEPVVHIVARTGNRKTEVAATSGVVEVRCRACDRWSRVRIRKGEPQLVEKK